MILLPFASFEIRYCALIYCYFRLFKMLGFKLLILVFITFKKINAVNCYQCSEEKSVYNDTVTVTDVRNKILAEIGTIETNIG